MTDDGQMSGQPVLTGSAFLYQQPELLTPESHGALGLTPPERPFDFVREERVVPVTMAEFSVAQRYFPIIFSSLENPVPLAVTGVLDDVNLFVDDDGMWDPMAYIPSYLRCYPFAFATETQGRIAVVIDRKAAAVTENPRYPFFENGELSESARQMMQLCSRYEEQRQRTQAFTEKLKELQLLTPQQANYTPEGETEPQVLANYVAVDTARLRELDKDGIYELHESEDLSAIYLHLSSLDNWRHLMARRLMRQRAAREAATLN